MVNEEKAKSLLKQIVYKCYDSLGYGKKKGNTFGGVLYNVNGKTMTLSEYQDYCLQRELKKFEIK